MASGTFNSVFNANVVKLDRRHKHLSYGFTHGIRFEYYGQSALRVESQMNYLLPREYVFGDPRSSTWFSAFGSITPYARYYWIYVRDEKILTLLSLRMG